MKSLRLILSGSALAFFASCFLWLVIAEATPVHVNGYTRKDGTYVAPYIRTSPNHTKNDNYSTKGNVNPYTGEEGTKPGDGGSVTTTTTTDTEVAAPQAAKPAHIVTPLKPGTIADLKGGMTETDLKQVLGQPKAVEGKGSYEIWTYPSGTVFFSPKSGVIAWREKK